MSSKTWLIYKHTNLVNGKVYVGQTCFTMEQRWKSHLACAIKGSNLPFHKALKKYGKDQWSHEILECNITDQETANVRERFWIQSFSTLLTENGYNCWGGHECFEASETTRQKMSFVQSLIQNDPSVREKAARTRKQNGFTHSEAMRKNLSVKNKGQKRSEDFRKRISEINKEVQNRPDVKEKRRLKAENSWQDPEVRKKRCDAMKAVWERRRLEKLNQESSEGI